MKRIVSMILVISIALSTMSLSVYAESVFEDFTGDTKQEMEMSSFQDEDLFAILEEEGKTNRFIVKPKANIDIFSVESIDSAEISDMDVEDITPYVYIELEEKVDPDAFMAMVSDSVEFIQPDYPLALSANSNVEIAVEYPLAVGEVLSSLFDRNQNLNAAHEVSTGVGVTVAVIDTGIDITHPALLGQIEGGWNFVDESSLITVNENGIDDHGTHIAGIIASVAPDAKIMPLQAFDHEGKAYTSDIIEAIRYAEEHGAAIINCSWGCREENLALKDTIKNSNMLFITAAGNGRSNIDKYPIFPASYNFENVISVASINDDGGMSCFSNYGEEIDIAAWGRDIVSAIPGGGYKKMSGTSMSSAFVAGAAALVMDANKTSVEETKQIILECGDQVNVLEGKVAQGRVLNFIKAINCIESGEILEIDAYDDFDVFKKPTESEGLELFSSKQVKQVATGSSHTIILMTDGTVWSWGDNTYTQLGYTLEPEEYDIFDEVNKKKATIRPRQVPGLTDIEYIAAGYDTSMAVKNDGTVYGWGYCRYGALSTGYTYDDSTLPTISTISNVEKIVLEDSYTIYLKEDQSVWVSGLSFFGVLTSTQSRGPIYIAKKVDLLCGAGNVSNDAIDVVASGSCLVTMHRSNYKNRVSVWLPNYLVESDLYGPRAIVDNAKSVATIGIKDTYVLSPDGTEITRWNGHREGKSWTTKPVRKLEGKGDTLILLYEDGTVGSLGKNELGQLGNSTNTDSLNNFTSVLTMDDSSYVDLSNIEMVSTFGTHSLAVNQSGELYSWGLNSNGQLGNTLVDCRNYARKSDSSIVGFIPPNPVSIGYGLPISKLVLPKQVTAKLDNDSNIILNVNWHTEEYNAELAGSAQIISGEFTDDILMIKNSNNVIPTITVNVEYPKTVTSVETIQPISLEYGKSWEDAYSRGKIKTQAEITLDDNTKITLPIIWESSSFRPCYFEQTQEIIGTFEECYSTAYIGIENLLLTLVVEIQPPKLTKLEAGQNHSLMLKEDGTVWAWGDNSYGQLGDGTTTQRLLPQKIPGLENIKDISAGYYHNLALDSNGTVWEWGRNIGSVPVQVNIENPATDVSAGQDYSVVCAEGIYTWGINDIGQLGQGTTNLNYSSTPTLVIACETGKTPKSVSAGRTHAIVCTKEGELWGWGDNRHRELGGLNGLSYTSTPTRVGISMKKAIAGNQISIFEKTDGKMMYTGKWTNTSSPVSASEYIYDPDRPAGEMYVLQSEKFSCGDSFNLWYGSWVWSWGENNYGQLGNGQGASNFTQMQKVLDEDTGEQIYAAFAAAGGQHALYAQSRNIGPNYRLFAYACGDNTYGQLGDGTTINSKYPIEVGKPREVVDIEKKTIHVDFNTPVTSLELPNSLNVSINGGVSQIMPVAWDTSTYDATRGGEIQTLLGTLTLPSGVVCPLEDETTVSIEMGHDPAKAITTVKDPETVIVPPNTEEEGLKLPEKVGVILADGSELELQVEWITAAYDKTKLEEEQILTGNFILRDGISNPNNLPPQVKVIVKDVPQYPITGINPREITIMQNVPFEPVEKDHFGGEQTTAENLPSTAVALFAEREQEELLVNWDFQNSDFDYTVAGTYTILGDVIIPENSNIVNPDRHRPTLIITVAPTTHEVWDIESVEVSVLLETPLSELDSILESEGKNQIAVCADSDDGSGWTTETYLFCNITVAEDEATDYNMNMPGTYTVTALMPNNFININTDDNTIEISVEVLEPSTITKAEARMTAYQSVAPKYMTDIPNQALLTLENGKTILSDVEWDWNHYDTDSSQDHIVYGTLQNLPAAAKEPVTRGIIVTLIINTIEAQYEVTNVTGTAYEASTCLTLDELNCILDPTLALTLESVGEEVPRVITYELPITLEEGDSGFDPKVSGEYTFISPFTLAENIVWPENISQEVVITTEKVEIIEIDTVSAIVSEGTAFGEIPLPAQVVATVSCKDPDGEHKKIPIDVMWAEPDDYTAAPEIWGTDGTVVYTANGVLSADCGNYISNVQDTAITAEITMIPNPTLVSISPNLFPVDDILFVPVGSTLDKIYAGLEVTKVELTLEDYNGNVYTKEVSFVLRTEDNPHYDPLDPEAKDYTLNAYLLLDEGIKNPDELGVRVKVSTEKYNISAFETITRTYDVGTPFASLDLPAEIMTRWGNNQSEPLGVNWNGTNYNPEKLGIQQIPGTLVTPLPLHLENTRNRQPRARITLVEPNAQLQSLTPVDPAQMPMPLSAEGDDGDEVPGYIEYFFWAEYLHEDGHTSTEMISILVEDSSDSANQ